MSPFSSLLQALRTSRQVRQSDLAGAMGYDPSYISALENGLKGPPPKQFVQRLVVALKLSPAEETELQWAIRASERRLAIDVDAPQDIYMFMSELREKLPHLGPAAVHTLRSVLSLSGKATEVFDRPRRRVKRPANEEAAMQ